ncbi:MAG: hypothetical protein L0Z51_00505 [Candidatus Latescibacteria bacterium]|nr:hypothetical protein [Candidatus Latescibacterota bacterium]
MMERGLVHYLPIATTVLAAVFCWRLVRRYRERRARHLGWWAVGMFTYGLGTALESAITLFGNSIALTKAWYVAGALLGGYPLAQGSVYLLMSRRTANRLTAITLPVIAACAVLVVLSPTLSERLEAHRPSGAVLGWQWIRLMTPLINGYSFAFLAGGAVFSAIRYARMPTIEGANRTVGNALIAFGALLPGIGGSMAKAGMVEALYVGEFIGLLFIFAGYRACLRPVAVLSSPDISPASPSAR